MAGYSNGDRQLACQAVLWVEEVLHLVKEQILCLEFTNIILFMLTKLFKV